MRRYVVATNWAVRDVFQKIKSAIRNIRDTDYSAWRTNIYHGYFVSTCLATGVIILLYFSFVYKTPTESVGSYEYEPYTPASHKCSCPINNGETEFEQMIR